MSRRSCDLREARYRDSGVTSHMMDVGKVSAKFYSEVVVHGTVNGNMLRFNSHSCAPNFVFNEMVHSATILIAIISAKNIIRRAYLRYNYSWRVDD